MKRALKLPFIIALVLSVVIAPIPAIAQDGETLVFGEAKLGQVVGPQGAIFNFQGSAGDTLEVEVIGIGAFAPTIALQDFNRQTIAQEDNTARSTNARLSFTLFVDGTYYVVVNGADNSVGQFTVLVNRGLPPGIPLNPDTPTDGVVGPDFPAVYYEFSVDPVDNSVLSIRSTTQGYSPKATVLSSTGETVALIDTQRLVAVTLEFGPGAETYKLAIELGSFSEQAGFNVILQNAADFAAQPSEPSGSSSSTSSSNAGTSGTSSSSSSSTCQVYAPNNNAVNVRTGGSTNHPAVGRLLNSPAATGTGYNAANGGWYEIALANGVVGWVYTSVVSTSGDCSNLPVRAYVAAPPGSGTSGSGTGTGGSGTGGGPTGTEEPAPATTEPDGPPPATTPPDDQNPPPPSPTDEPPPAQVAQPDSDPVYNIDLDFKRNEQQTLTNNISYPGGDTTDQVIYTVKGFDSVTFQGESTVVVTCSGPGAENAMVRFGNARAQPTSCNPIAQRTFTHGEYQATNRFWIFLESGSDAYVTWSAQITTRKP